MFFNNNLVKFVLVALVGIFARELNSRNKFSPRGFLSLVATSCTVGIIAGTLVEEFSKNGNIAIVAAAATGIIGYQGLADFINKKKNNMNK